MEEVVGILEEAYHKSFQLFKSGHFKREPILGKLRDLGEAVTRISGYSYKWLLVYYTGGRLLVYYKPLRIMI